MCLITASPQLEERDEDMAMDRWCIHPALDGLRLLNTKISLVQTIGQYELPGMKTRGGQSIVRARGHVHGDQNGARGDAGRRRGSAETRRRRQSKTEKLFYFGRYFDLLGVVPQLASRMAFYSDNGPRLLGGLPPAASDHHLPPPDMLLLAYPDGACCKLLTVSLTAGCCSAR